MNLAAIGTSVTRVAHRTGLVVMKNLPTIMQVGGCVGFVGAVYSGCKASMKLESTLDRYRKDISEAKTDKEKAKIKRTFAKEVVKLYMPTGTLVITSTCLVLGGHHIMSKRMAAVTSAYKLSEEAYNRYREKVRAEEGGIERDQLYSHGYEMVDSVEVSKDQDGNETITKTKKWKKPDIPSPSIYARFFDEYSSEWTNNPEYNLNFLRAQQRYATNRLMARGHLFLNEVYEALGLPHTQAGAVVGWIYDPKDPTRDNVVDFGIYDKNDQLKRDFVNGVERSILLDFNVDGVIYDLI